MIIIGTLTTRSVIIQACITTRAVGFMGFRVPGDLFLVRSDETIIGEF